MLDKASKRAGAVKGKVALTFKPGDPGYNLLPKPKAPTYKAPKLKATQPVPPEPKTAGYGALKDFGTQLTDDIAGAGTALKGKVLGDVKAKVKDTKYGAAKAAGVEKKQRASDRNYARMEQESRPVHEAIQGKDASTLVKNAIEGRANPSVKVGSGKFERQKELDLDTLRSAAGNQGVARAIGETIRNYAHEAGGRGPFRSDKFAKGMSAVKPKAKAFMAKQNPAATRRLENTATAAEAMHVPVQPGNLTATGANVGSIIATITGLMQHPWGRAALVPIIAGAGGLGSRRNIEVMAGLRKPGQGLGTKLLSRLPLQAEQSK
jgi:hypothetical protein